MLGSNLPEITEMVRYILYSDYVVLDGSHKETPLSAMIVAPPEHGKTAVVEQFNPNNGILHMTNVTAYGLQKQYFAEMQKGNIKRILVPDFVNPANKKQDTINSTVTFFNSYISWEGVGSIATYAMTIRVKDTVKGALLTTMATEDFKRMRKSLAAVGFLSRMLVISYRYSREKADEILKSIVTRRAPWSKVELQFPDGKVSVNLPGTLALELMPTAKRLGESAHGIGLRGANQLMMMAKCRALSEGRDVVTKEDINRVLYLCNEYVGEVK